MIKLGISRDNCAILLLAVLFMLNLVSAAVHDIRTRTISNRSSAMTLGLALGSVFIVPQISIVSRCVGAVCISVPMLLLSCLHPGAFGGGDIKLMAAGGAFLGWKGIVLSMILAIWAGGAVCIILLFTKKKGRKESIIFGPFLCLGMILTLFLGNYLWGWIFSSVC